MRRALAFLLLAAPAAPLRSQQPAAATGTVAGVVRDTAGQPIPGVRVTAGSDTSRPALTDTLGGWRLPGVAAGLQRIQFRRLGYVPAEFAVPVEPGEELRLQVELFALPVRLADIEVSRRANPELDRVGYYERRRLRDAGILTATFIDPEEIDQRRPTRTSHLFSAIPGLDVVYRETRGRSVPFLFGRTTTLSGRCQPAIFIDGIEQGQTPMGRGQMDIDLDMIVSPLDIKAIEVYSFGSRVPEQFQSMRNVAACGSVVIWTRLTR